MVKNTESIDTITGSRIPDFMDNLAKTMTEIKNVGYQYASSQLRGMIQYAKDNGYTFTLVVRQGATISKSLAQRIAAIGGQVIEVSAETMESYAQQVGSTLDGLPMIVPTEFLERANEIIDQAIHGGAVSSST